MGIRRSALEGLVVTPEFWKNKRVFLTGHTGFKGSWLSLLLKQLGARVSGYALEPVAGASLFQQAHVEQALASHQIADIRSLPDLVSAIETSGARVIFHLAAQALVRQSYVDPIDNWSSNVMGTVNVLEAARVVQERYGEPVTVVAITTDKVYHNREWHYAYRETDRLGGKDPYSASKAACELAISSFRDSFAGPDSIRVSSARAGNVIGGGDWAENRIVPDLARALAKGEALALRSPNAVRPWQHVLDPLLAYLSLAEALTNADTSDVPRFDSFNFGPDPTGQRTVQELVECGLRTWTGEWEDVSPTQAGAPHEANLLSLTIEKANQVLDWSPVWEFERSVEETMAWYKKVHEGANPSQLCETQIDAFLKDAK